MKDIPWYLSNRFITEISDGWGEETERKDTERLAELIREHDAAKNSEIERLRAELGTQTDIVEMLRDDIREFKQEIERLRADNSELEKVNGYYCDELMALKEKCGNVLIERDALKELLRELLSVSPVQYESEFVKLTKGESLEEHASRTSDVIERNEVRRELICRIDAALRGEGK